MPFFRTTTNILVDQGEYFDKNWMDSDKLILPPNSPWDYKREMQIEDVDLWEVVYEDIISVYAAWSPYAEFYMMKPSYQAISQGHQIATFYGPKASDRLYARMKELGVHLPLQKNWVENDQMWLY